MPRPLYIVMHVPKTAGSNLRYNFELNFGERCLFLYSDLIGQPALNAADADALHEHRRQNGALLNRYVADNTTPLTDFLFGHKVNIDLHRHVREDIDPRYITFLRDPVERTISLYHYVRSSPQIPEDYVMREENWTLDEWLDRTKRDIKNSQLSKFLSEKTLQGERELDDQLNFQLNSVHLEEAKRQLENFWFVGLTETFDADANYLYGKLGAWRFHPERIVNSSPRKEAVPAQTRARIASMSSLGMEFYHFARTQRSQFLRKNYLDYQLNKNKALVLQAMYKRRAVLRHFKNASAIPLTP